MTISSPRAVEAASEDAIVQRCRTDIFRYALRRLGSPEDAEDVAAEVCAIALEKRPSFRGEVDVRLWLLGIARHRVVDRLRRRGREATAAWEPADLAQSPEAVAIQADERARWRRLVLELPDAQREALLLQTTEGLTIEQIAHVLRRSSRAVNSLLGRARATLRQRAGEMARREEEEVRYGRRNP